jgi:hypothetical protein
MPVMQATATVDIAPGMVLGAEFGQCPALLTHYLRKGGNNPEGEVRLLQGFLVDIEGESGLNESGVFDEALEDAVRRFQERYAGDILSPWGVEDPTGYVYYTTRKKVNELACDNASQFPLSISQVNEMEHYKSGFALSSPLQLTIPARAMPLDFYRLIAGPVNTSGVASELYSNVLLRAALGLFRFLSGNIFPIAQVPHAQASGL